MVETTALEAAKSPDPKSGEFPLTLRLDKVSSIITNMNFISKEISDHRNYPLFCWIGLLWWVMMDSNQRNSGYEPDALTNCANDPKWRLERDLNPRTVSGCQFSKLVH